ncbi:CapA family protein [Amycolatopsis benzoatilytica]|uniref:CapA family protein n=1 Tax=Amycolatopsis benzoatilytica TaxID=346045 RepID=UPI000375897F|nr:CapA family protein [Amycolatopsis benzoatilytica]
MSAHHPTIFLGGDVMTGRGIDQILPHRGDPALRERAVTDARTYVTLAERASGPIARPVEFAWPWGDALAVLDEYAPDVRLINLETSITGDGQFAPGKAVHYRMHPDNLACLAVARPDVCVLANNHVLDFGARGLADTLDTLAKARISAVGAGPDARRAHCPVSVGAPGERRVVIAAGGMESSGIPRDWAATEQRPGVAFVPDLSDRSAEALAERAVALKRPGDLAIVSLHWGSNWGYSIASAEVRFAHRLIDAGADLVYGHSSHHPRPIEVYRGKLILYGCGDLINDYEGITGFEAYRDELRLLYFATLDPGSGTLVSLRLVPLAAKQMRLRYASSSDVDWLRSTLERVSVRFGTTVQRDAGGALTVSAA